MKLPDHVQHWAVHDGLPFWSPTLVGCAIAVNKTYFYSIGAFDEEQYNWGGENLELAFRAWQCGGSVITLPCSRVGHIFRPLPDRIGDGEWMISWQKNLMRVADVWMDDYKKYFYSSTRVYTPRRVEYTTEEKASLQKRFRLRKELKCKSFDWYLKNIVPELPLPPRHSLYHGEVTNYGSKACWQVMEDDYINITYNCYEHKIIPENIFTLTKEGFLTYHEKCLRFVYPKPALRMERCPEKANIDFGIWSMDFPSEHNWGSLKVRMQEGYKVTTWCITQVTSAVDIHQGMQMPQASVCDDGNQYQYWGFTHRFDHSDDFIKNLPQHNELLR